MNKYIEDQLYARMEREYLDPDSYMDWWYSLEEPEIDMFRDGLR